MTVAHPRTQTQSQAAQTRRRQPRQATLSSFFAASSSASTPSSAPEPPVSWHIPNPVDVLAPAYTDGDPVRDCTPTTTGVPPSTRTLVTPRILVLNLPPRPATNSFASNLCSLSINPSPHAPRTATYSAASALPSPPLSPLASQSQPQSHHSAEQRNSPEPSVLVEATPTTATTATTTSALVDTPTDNTLPPMFSTCSPHSEKDELPCASSRKRMRRTFTPPLPSRPRTRASLRAAIRSPSPPAAVAVVPVTTTDRIPKASRPDGFSRLNRARNAARRAAATLTTSDATKVNLIDDANFVEVIPDDVPESIDSSPADAEPSSDESLLERPDPAPKRRTVKPSKTVHSPNPPSQKKRPLHPFFSTTAAAVSTSRDRLKAPRVNRPVCDAWFCPNATIHVNAAPPLSCLSPAESHEVPRAPIVRDRTSAPSLMPRVMGVKFCHFVSQNGGSLKLQTRARPPIRDCIDESGLWAERYKSDARLDTINAPLAAELCDWLRAWYEKRNASSVGDGSGSEASIISELDEDRLFAVEKETIAIITGPVGCGKTTLVGTVARTMGLSILEINSSVCRNGKRVRDIVGEALTSHRVGRGSKGVSFTTVPGGATPESSSNCTALSRVSLAKTLILFEEVDELQSDEKGFWASVLELASSSDCKRPIVCTANSFTSTMRQFFVEKRADVRTDFDRLLVNTKEEPLLNAVLFKHLSFPDARSERQTTSVLQRVALTEGIGAHRHLCDGLSVMHRYDIRKAINQLQFWGRVGVGGMDDSLHDGENVSKTVSLTESEVQVGMDFIRSGVEHSMGPPIFTTGATNFCDNHGFKGDSISKGGCDSNDLETLRTWTMSLEAISDCDVLVGTRRQQTQSRNADARLPAEALNLDADLLQFSQNSEDLMDQALEVSRSRLTFFRTNTYVRNVALHATGLRQDCVAERAVMPMLPRARRPLVTDVVPALISMVRAEDERKSKAQNGESGALVAPIRRTRLRSRQCGLGALDLDASTLSILRKVSIAPR